MDDILASLPNSERDDFEETLAVVKRVCPVLTTSKFPQGLPLPTEEDLQEFEKEYGLLNPQLKRFFEECDNLSLKVYDLPSITYNPDLRKSPFSKINQEFRAKSSLQTHLAFCYDNGNYYCIDQDTGAVMYWQRDDKSFSKAESDHWKNFNDWLKREFLSNQK